jgi:SRSO17 transposase
VVPALASYAADEAGYYWIIDDTGFPKKGPHSVGVARQYCGQLGKQDNCQVAVSLSLATQRGSLPIAYHFYLPHEWIDHHPTRRQRAGIPENKVFATKPQIALAQLREAIASDIPPGVVLADAGYGDETTFQDGLTEMGLLYAVGIKALAMQTPHAAYRTVNWREGTTLHCHRVSPLYVYGLHTAAIGAVRFARRTGY